MTNDEDTLKEIAARLVGKVVIEHISESPRQFGRFVVNHLSGPSTTFVYGINQSEREAWARAMRTARRKDPGALIFGPPGYDVDL
jgi:hypothetical protein